MGKVTCKDLPKERIADDIKDKLAIIQNAIIRGGTAHQSETLNTTLRETIEIWQLVELLATGTARTHTHAANIYGPPTPL